MNCDAALLTNHSLKSFLLRHRLELIKLYKEVCDEHKRTSLGGQNRFGLKHGAFSLGLNQPPPLLLRNIISTAVQALPEYDFYTPEIFFGLGTPVRPHNDVSLFLRSGQELPLQLWFLLESCCIKEGRIYEVRKKNALEVCTTSHKGPVYAGTQHAITPEGTQDLNLQQTVGGDQMQNGDLLLFKNGCVHFTQESRRPGLFRVGLALRAIHKSRQDDANYLRWMKQLWTQQASLFEGAKGSYIRSAQKMLLSQVDDKAPDPDKLHKIERNDYVALTGALKSYTVAAEEASSDWPGFIELRTAQSLQSQ